MVEDELSVLQERFNFYNAIKHSPRYNIAPSQEVLSIINNGHVNKAGFLKWGLIPPWAKDPKIGNKMINARSETIDEKASFKHLLKRKRCLIIADSFFEWKITENGKHPMRIKLKSDEPFAMAGLWEKWEKDENILFTCTIITTESNELVKPIHDRMPVILPKENESIWLDPSIDDREYLKSLLKPYDADMMEAYEVSTLVNSPKNDGAEVIRKMEKGNKR